MDYKRILNFIVIIAVAGIFYTSCAPKITQKTENKTVPTSYKDSQDTLNIARNKWQEFFTDPYLRTLIDTALKNNQELNITLQEIVIARNEARARKGDYLPMLNIGAGAGIFKEGRYTRFGAVDATTDIKPGTKMPDPLPNFTVGPNLSWEVDIWKKLRNSRKSAMLRYLATTEGKNFMVTRLIAEIANSYFELMALDNQLEILRTNIKIQQNALDIVRQLKNAAKVTELAVSRFEAEVAKNQSLLFYISQQITETENNINLLVGRFPQTVARNSQTFPNLISSAIHEGIPSQLLANRPDIRRAEQELTAAKLDVKIAKANFYPGFRITAGMGFQAFNPKLLLEAPESILYYATGELVAPLINRNAIKALYYSANARQIQAVYNYERAILRAHIEVVNQLANIQNLQSSYELRSKQVDALTHSINISTALFQSARADYMEVLLTQRDALDSRFDLIETKKQQMHAVVNVYQALGGGWY
ncbi:MAG TPA: TolC family protein [Cytophagaceae bacterium]|jgi:NodT family efflux transporter outer membrane factor (OMF) lipoprotein